MSDRRRRRRASLSAGPADTVQVTLRGEGRVFAAEAAGADGKPRLRRFEMRAYTGKPMRPKLTPPLKAPVVVDLQGLDLGRQGIPALKDHDSTKHVGHVESFRTDGTQLVASGVVSGAGDAAREVVAANDNGFRWQTSIGADLEQLQFLAAGQVATVNGRAVQGPLYIARKSRLREISFLTQGADDDTVATIAATAAKGQTMTFAQWLQANGFDPKTISAKQRVTLYASYAGQVSVSAGAAGQTFEEWAEAGEIDLEAEGDDALSEEQVTSLRTAFDGLQQQQGGSKKKPVKKKARRAAADVTRAAAAAALAAGGEGDVVDATVVDELREELDEMRRERRETRIRALCGAGHDDIADAAIEAGWSDDHVRAAIEAADLRGRLPQAVVRTSRRSGAPEIGVVVEAALCLAGGFEDVEEQFEANALEEAHRQFRGRIGLQELLMEAALANGYSGRPHGAIHNDLRGVMEAAFGRTSMQAGGFSSFSLPGILSNTANKFSLEGFMSIEDTWRRIAAIRPVRDFKSVTSYRLTGGFEYEEVGPDGQLKHGSVGEESYTNRAKTYGKMFSITRQDIINDDLGSLTAVPKKIGRGAALKFNKVFWAAFLDNSTFFTSGHGNYFEGATTVLGVDSLTTAEAMFLNQVDADGDPIGVTPDILLVPNALSTTATTVTRATEIRDTTASTKYATDNPHAGKWEAVRSSYLSSSALTGNSTTAWYLLCSLLPVIEAAFLNGKTEPTVESADADFSTLGVEVRGYHDFGCAKQDYRGGVKSKGAA